MNLISQLMHSDNPVAVIIMVLYQVPAILIALTLHELSHGYVAYRCGDPTAQMMGRLSFNPLKHLNPIGTICMFLFGFGWANPVPVNSRNFKHFRRDDFLVSIAGVVMNFCLFFFTTMLMIGVNELIFKKELWAVPMELLNRRDFLSFDGWNYGSILTGGNQLLVKVGKDGYAYYYQGWFEQFLRTPWLLYVQRFLMIFASMNLSLCLFNLLPIPPLDGFHVFNDILCRGRLHIPANVMRVLMVVFLIFCFLTDFISNFIWKCSLFVQHGVLDALLWLFRLG